MVERFVEFAGTISVTSGASTVNGAGTIFSGKDREGNVIIAFPVGAAPVIVGVIEAVSPVGVYDNLSLPLLFPYRGTTLTDVEYALIDSIALVSMATPASIYSRFASFLAQSMGLVGNLIDTVDLGLVQQNTLFVDEATRRLYQYRQGVMQQVFAVGLAFNPRGAWDTGITYDTGDLVSHGGVVFISSVDDNLANEPDDTPLSDAFWTYMPSASVSEVLAALGISGFIISEDPPDPLEGVEGTIWLQVAP